MRHIDEIIIHCTATQAGRNVTVSEIDKWHRKRGFNSIGYHYVIYLDGTIAAGRPEQRIGAHCSGHNAHSIGICYVGGYDNYMHPTDTRTPEQKAALRMLVKRLVERYPGSTLHGHNEFAAKACPCFDVSKDL